MFGFFTIVFIIYYILRFKKIGEQRAVEISQMHVDKHLLSPTERDEYEKKIMAKSMPMLVIGFLIILEYFYLGFAISHDPFVIPTLAMIAYDIYLIVNLFINKKDGDTLSGARSSLETVRNNLKPSLKKKLIISLNVIYFCYMLIIHFFV